MGNISDYYRKGGELMMQALEAYNNGEFDEGDKLRQQANKYYDYAEGMINSDEGKIQMMFGEARNFGVMYNVFEQNMIDILKRKNGKQIIKEFYDLIKHNKTLNEQFKIYDAIENAENVEDAEKFVNEISSIIKTFDKDKIINENNKLITLIKRHNLNEYVEIPEETENLYEAIEYLMLNKKTINNVNNYINSKNLIKEHVEKVCKQNLNEEDTETIDSLKEKWDKVEENLNKELNKDEENLIETYLNPNTNKELFFNEQKDKTLKKINETIDSINDYEQKQEWKKIYENVESKTFNVKDGLALTAEMIEIYNTI